MEDFKKAAGLRDSIKAETARDPVACLLAQLKARLISLTNAHTHTHRTVCWSGEQISLLLPHCLLCASLEIDITHKRVYTYT